MLIYSKKVISKSRLALAQKNQRIIGNRIAWVPKKILVAAQLERFWPKGHRRIGISIFFNSFYFTISIFHTTEKNLLDDLFLNFDIIDQKSAKFLPRTYRVSQMFQYHKEWV